jgi:hypothetical protein
MPYDSEEEAIEIANGTPYGLSGGVWSSDRLLLPCHRRHRLASQGPCHALARAEQTGRDRGLRCAQHPSRLAIGEPDDVDRHQNLAGVLGQGLDGLDQLPLLERLIGLRAR